MLTSQVYPSRRASPAERWASEPAVLTARTWGRPTVERRSLPSLSPLFRAAKCSGPKTWGWSSVPPLGLGVCPLAQHRGPRRSGWGPKTVIPRPSCCTAQGRLVPPAGGASPRCAGETRGLRRGRRYLGPGPPTHWAILAKPLLPFGLSFLTCERGDKARDDKWVSP